MGAPGNSSREVVVRMLRTEILEHPARASRLSAMLSADERETLERLPPGAARRDYLTAHALRYKPHPTHSTVDRSVKTADELKPRRTYLTHICHDLAHERAESLLPEHVRLAYDGLELRVA